MDSDGLSWYTLPVLKRYGVYHKGLYYFPHPLVKNQTTVEHASNERFSMYLFVLINIFQGIPTS